ncbi:MAG: SUMF1/EgtB/PvdO family nonheme iron enzyme [Akkermansia sp.]
MRGVCKASPKHAAPADWSSRQAPPGRETHPVVQMSYRDAQDYCRWRPAAELLPANRQRERPFGKVKHAGMLQMPENQDKGAFLLGCCHILW